VCELDIIFFTLVKNLVPIPLLGSSLYNGRMHNNLFPYMPNFFLYALLINLHLLHIGFFLFYHTPWARCGNWRLQPYSAILLCFTNTDQLAFFSSLNNFSVLTIGFAIVEEGEENRAYKGGISDFSGHLFFLGVMIIVLQRFLFSCFVLSTFFSRLVVLGLEK